MITVIELIYKKPLAEVDAHLVAHREFLQSLYDKGLLLASGPKEPRDGGIIIALAESSVVEKIMKEDPFQLHGIADYRFMHFDPVKHNILIAPLL